MNQLIDLLNANQFSIDSVCGNECKFLIKMGFAFFSLFRLKILTFTRCNGCFFLSLSFFPNRELVPPLIRVRNQYLYAFEGGSVSLECEVSALHFYDLYQLVLNYNTLIRNQIRWCWAWKTSPTRKKNLKHNVKASADAYKSVGWFQMREASASVSKTNPCERTQKGVIFKIWIQCETSTIVVNILPL